MRSAGGTGQAMSVLIADVVRRELGITSYQPTKGEIERYKEEIPLYKRAQHLQYTPSVDEIDQIVSQCPICINGEGTEKVEVTGYRDLPRVESNRLRGGACLVIAEGLCLKAPKLMKHVTKLKLEGWDFLDHFVNKKKGNEKEKEETKKDQKNAIPDILPSTKYIGEVIAGRPVFGHPSRPGGFRLRYGRARTAGLASTAISPAAMVLSDEFIAIGTQMKMERPGKATIGTPCDELEGPIVLKHSGDLIQLQNQEDVDLASVKQIVDFGEILIPYGEFLENNANLPDASYTHEWWIQDLQKTLNLLPEKNTLDQIKKADSQTQQHIKKELQQSINLIHPDFDEALLLSKTYDIPLHPDHNLFWHDSSIKDVQKLAKYIKEHGSITESNQLSLPLDQTIKEIITTLGIFHTKQENTILTTRYAQALLHCLGLTIQNNQITTTDQYQLIEQETPGNQQSTVEYVSKLSKITIRPRAPIRIGTRMGRPEKAAERKMRPPPHVLFPLGNYGTNQRLFSKAAEKGTIEVDAGKRICTKCEKNTYKIMCDCGGHTEPVEDRIEIHTINIKEELDHAKKHLKIRRLPDTIKGVQGTISKHKTPEPVEKGILRAKHEVSVFKDGTIRFDMTDAPLTHFKPKELHVSIEKLKKLGYTHDIEGKPLKDYDQICELKVQDVVIATSCAEYFMKVAHFIDDLLVRYYHMDKFYNIRKIDDLTGHLVIGLAPHTSGGSLARIIGFTDAKVCFSHPYYHAAKRRNCVSSDTRVMIFKDSKPLHESIKNLYDHIPCEEIIVDDFKTKKKRVSGIQAFSFSKFQKKMIPQKITGIYKAKSPNHLMKIKLKSGRSLTVSPYHRCLVIKNEEPVIKKGLELDQTDYFPIAKRNDIDSSDLEQFDLVDIFSTIARLKNKVMIRRISNFVRQLVDECGGLSATSKKLDINKKTFSNYLYRDSIPLAILLKLLKLNKKTLNNIPNHAKLSMKRESVGVNRFIKIDKWFMKIIGYYLAEGHSRSIQKNYYHISFARSEKALKKEIGKCISNSFGINYYETDRDITISNRILYEFFTEVLSLGKNASTKKLPSLLSSLPLEKMKYLLQAYFSGDGSVEKSRLHVTCSSVNKRLLENIGFQLTRFGIFYRIRYEEKIAGGAVKTFYEKMGRKLKTFHLYYLSIRSTYARIFYENIGFSLKRKQDNLASVLGKERTPRVKEFGEYLLDPIKEISMVQSSSQYVYDLEVENEHNFQINDSIVTNNCDGDEDGLMLLMDALLNFSHEYIPDKRGGKMDLPLILTTRLDPSEVDKEAHNVDCLSRYPLDFYEATTRHEHPKNWEDKMDVVGNRLKTPLQYEQLGFTHDTSDVSSGPVVSRYKTLNTMMDKMNAQLNLAAKIRAVDEADVAYKVIERHFLPDILGNLKAFSKQSVRCPSCNITYRRIPLNGKCRKCGGKLSLTVHEKSVKKYLEISKEVADRYHIPSYAHQRINLVEKNIDSLFMSDKVKKTKLTDFL
ncbi:MAG TPA: DNA polymerase II large subunit [Candidatus Thermoplasmatota archaeon]|nr:DNA polymerase II large subunit [Candidatus Thermoplasmatota archaeon]